MSAISLAKSIVKELARAGFDKGDRAVKERMWEAFARGFLQYIEDNPLPGTTNTDETVKVSANDDDAQYLIDKLVGGTNIVITEQNDGLVETIEISTTAGANDSRIERFTAANSSDTTYNLIDAPIAGTERVFHNGQLLRPGAGEDYEVTGSTVEILSVVYTGSYIDVEYEYSP